MTEEKKALDRYLSPLDVWSMAFGCMVGWGVLVMPGTTFLPVAGPAGTVIAMVIGIAVMLVVCANMSWLMKRWLRVWTPLFPNRSSRTVFWMNSEALTGRRMLQCLQNVQT